jgi:hypothetical protein
MNNEVFKKKMVLLGFEPRCGEEIRNTSSTRKVIQCESAKTINIQIITLKVICFKIKLLILCFFKINSLKGQKKTFNCQVWGSNPRSLSRTRA